MLATHPDVQSRARQEVLSVVGLSQPLSLASLDRLQYCAAVVKETLRYVDD